MAEETYAPLYLRGIERFNRRRYFESHELWEELWIGAEEPTRTFYKGLIQAAVALYHYENGNVHGARKLLEGSGEYLEPYRPKYLGLDIDRFLSEMSRCLASVLGPELPTSVPELELSLVPVVRLDPAPGPAAGV